MRWIDPPDGRPWALIAICGASLLLNVVLIANNLLDGDAAQPEEAVAMVQDDAPLEAVAATVADPALREGQAPAPIAEPELPEGMRVVHASVEHSFARTFQGAAPEHADVIAAIYARLFFWDLDLRRDLQKGDQIEVLYDWDGDLAEISAASYTSKKLGRTLTAYQYKASGDAFASWWDADGTEVPRRLVSGPIGAYDQVTSLLKDRPTHKGMDFKTPEGTEVTSPRSGKVLRVDWNHAYNGNCAEIRYNDGTIARFLHLSRTDVREGQTVSAGQLVGLSGNTGRSTAPHLHYELEKDGRVIDPVDYHGVTQRTLPEADRASFDAEVSRLQGLLALES